MSANVFSQRLHSDVYPMGERVKIDSCRPGIVEHYHGACLMRSLRDGGHILHLHSQGAGALAPYQARVLAKVRLDRLVSRRVLTNGWRVEGHINAKPPQYSPDEMAVGAVDALGNQDVVARFQEGKVD